MDKKIVLFAHARSGSNSLGEILSSNSKIKLIIEPFNLRHLRESNSSFLKKMNVHDKESLDTYLKLIYKKYNGIKTIAYQLPFELNKHILLNSNHKVIFLTRKNVLQTVMSMLIGEKIDIWYVNKYLIEDYRKKMSELEIDCIDLKRIEEKMNRTKEEIRIYQEVLEKNNIPFFNLYYEELFGDEIDQEKKIELIRRIFEFLGYHDELSIPRIMDILNPENKKMTDEKVYLKVPNIHEIEREFANRENGYLFKRTFLKRFSWRE